MFQNNRNSLSGGVIQAGDVQEQSLLPRYTNITIENSIFTENRVSQRSGVISVHDNQNLYSWYPYIIGLTIQNCTFLNNGANSFGRVVYYYGTQPASIMDSTFTLTASHVNTYGGAIYSRTTLVLANNSFSGFRGFREVINVALSRDFVYPQNIEFKIEDYYFKDSVGGVIFCTGSQELIKCIH